MRECVALVYTNNELLKRNKKKIKLIYYCIKKIPKNESNQGGERPVHRKLRHW